MKNLKNFNHWISEVRLMAVKAKVYNKGDDQPMSKKQIDSLFNKQIFKDRFESGITPTEAFNNEMELWADAP